MADGGQEAATTTSSVVNLDPTPFVLGSVRRFVSEDECWGGDFVYDIRAATGGGKMEGCDGIGWEGGWTGGLVCL